MYVIVVDCFEGIDCKIVGRIFSQKNSRMNVRPQLPMSMLWRHAGSVKVWLLSFFTCFFYISNCFIDFNELVLLRSFILPCMHFLINSICKLFVNQLLNWFANYFLTANCYSFQYKIISILAEGIMSNMLTTLSSSSSHMKMSRWWDKKWIMCFRLFLFSPYSSNGTTV